MTENCNNSNQTTTNMRLKCGKTITIDNKDVQRIRILNDIVWEKTKPTTLRLSSSPSSVNSGKSFTLTATVVNSSGTGINGNVIFQGNGISGSKTVVAKNGIATLNVSSTNIGSNTYTATFLETDIYLKSEATTSVKINKEKPILTKYGDTTIYDTWKIGVKLTKSDGKTVLANRTISLKIDNKTYTAKTNSKGIASFQINIKDIGTGKKTATYIYSANNDVNSNDKNIYDNISISVQYQINNYKNKTLSVNNVNLGEKNTLKKTQQWESISDGYQCRKTNQTCYVGSYTIGTNSGTWNKPDILKITFKQDNIVKIKSATLKFNSASLSGACRETYLGGYFPNPPNIKLSVNGSSFTKGNGAKAFNRDISYGYYYSKHDNLSQTITWGEKVISSNPIISIDYGTNQGIEEACIKITKISLSVSYVPKQTTTF